MKAPSIDAAPVAQPAPKPPPVSYPAMQPAVPPPPRSQEAPRPAGRVAPRVIVKVAAAKAMSPNKVLAAGRAAAGRLFSGIPVLHQRKGPAAPAQRPEDDAALTMATLRNTIYNARLGGTESVNDAPPTQRTALIRWSEVLACHEPTKPALITAPLKSILKRRGSSSSV
jgi:hypothetical protein